MFGFGCGVAVMSCPSVGRGGRICVRAVWVRWLDSSELVAVAWGVVAEEFEEETPDLSCEWVGSVGVDWSVAD